VVAAALAPALQGSAQAERDRGVANRHGSPTPAGGRAVDAAVAERGRLSGDQASALFLILG